MKVWFIVWLVLGRGPRGVVTADVWTVALIMVTVSVVSASASWMLNHRER